MRDGSVAERNLLSKTGFRLRCANPLVRGHAPRQRQALASHFAAHRIYPANQQRSRQAIG